MIVVLVIIRDFFVTTKYVCGIIFLTHYGLMTSALTTCSDEHPETVMMAMYTIMAVLLEESEDIGDDLLHIILSVLGRDKKVSLSSFVNLPYIFLMFVF